jgi:hypothetical protein
MAQNHPRLTDPFKVQGTPVDHVRTEVGTAQRPHCKYICVGGVLSQDREWDDRGIRKNVLWVTESESRRHVPGQKGMPIRVTPTVSMFGVMTDHPRPFSPFSTNGKNTILAERLTDSSDHNWGKSSSGAPSQEDSHVGPPCSHPLHGSGCPSFLLISPCFAKDILAGPPLWECPFVCEIPQKAFSFLGSTMIWTWGLAFARQVLYYLSHAHSLFMPYFLERVLHFLPRASFRLWSSYLCLPYSLDFRCKPPCLAC